MDATMETGQITGDPIAEQLEIEFAAIRDLAALQVIANQARKRRAAEHAKEVVEERTDRVRSGRDPGAHERRGEGEAGQEGSVYHDMRLTELSTKQLITVLRDNPALRPSENTVGGKIVAAIVESVPPENLNQRSAPYLYSILRKALNNEVSINNPLNALSVEEFRYLRDVHPAVANNVISSLVSSAQGLVEPAQIQEFMDNLGAETPSARAGNVAQGEVIDASTSEGRGKLAAGELYLPPRYFQTNTQRDVAYALLSPKNLVEYLAREEQALSAVKTEFLRQDNGQEKWEKHFSKHIEFQVIQFFDELFVPLDESKPTEFFHSLAQQDYQQGFGVLLNRMESVFAGLPNFINQSQDAQVIEFRNMNFWSNQLTAYDEERRYKSKGSDERISAIERRVKKHTEREKMKLSDFMRNIKVLLTNEKELREFTHDAKALFGQPVGEKGFYPQLRDFSGRLAMSDIDEFLELPDNDVFMTAHSLYAKYLEEEFAKYDWRHQTTMFNTGYKGFNNKMESDVLDTLKLMYPEYEEWRLKRALSLGVGASLGIFMTEVEIAAMADAHLDAFGVDTYNDYYRNGGGALKPLNPFAHGAWRWQKEHTTMADLLFLPIRQRGKKMSQYWDHRTLFKEMQNYKQSFHDRSQKPLNDGATRLIEIMNFGQVGGPIKRATWRIIESIDHMAVYVEEGGHQTATLDFLETWKSIENVGFEVLLNFQRQVGPLFDIKNPDMFIQRHNLFKYLYQTYTRPGASDAEFEDYFNQLEAARARGEFLDKTRMPDKPFHKDEIYRFELDRAMAAILKRRIPSKFLRIERGRFMKEGKNSRLWDTIKREMGIEESTEFDEVIRDIGVAEALLRNETSKQMEEWMHHRTHLSDTESQRFNEFSTDYQLTETKIENFLGETFDRAVTEGKMTPEERTQRVQRAKQAFRLLDRKVDSDYMDNFAIKLLQRFQGGNANLKSMTDIAYSVAPEEMDMRFLNWRAGGPGVLFRANKETAMVEEKINKIMDDFPNLLAEIATNGKQDFGEVIKVLSEFKDIMTDLHGHSFASETAGFMGALTISYFKKDTAARNIFTKLGTIGKPNSMAAELAGTWKGVWEWEVSDIHRFISALEARRIVPKYATDVTDKLKYEEKPITIFGKTIHVRKTVDRGPHHEFNGKRLRQEYGATGKNIALEVVNKYAPLLAGVILLAALSDGIEDALEDVKESKKR